MNEGLLCTAAPKRPRRAWLVTVVVVAAAGCGRSGPPLASVHGMVTLEGTPLTHGTVSFVPDNARGTRGRMALGAIGPDGRFVLRSFTADDGALTGFHTVAILCDELLPVPADGAAEQPVPDEARSLIPVRYNDARTSGLTAEVKPGVKNEFLFNLQR